VSAMAHRVTILRRHRDWTSFLGVAVALLAVSILAGLPAITRVVSPSLLIAGVLAAAGILGALFVGMLKDVDELERRIAAEALALSFVVTIAAMFVYPFLEGLGLPPLRPQTVAFVLVASFAVGIECFSRRYR
jgi:putative Ca2+/H+ antiporter (TMEM165/GDT1 family)